MNITKKINGILNPNLILDDSSVNGTRIESGSSDISFKTKDGSVYKPIKAGDPLVGQDVLLRKNWWIPLVLLSSGSSVSNSSGSYSPVVDLKINRAYYFSSVSAILQVRARQTLLSSGDVRIVAIQGGTTIVLGTTSTITDGSMGWLPDVNIGEGISSLGGGEWRLELQSRKISGLGAIEVDRAIIHITG